MANAQADTEHKAGDLVAGRYVIRAELGRGGTGAVYEVEHVLSGQRLALKTLHARFGKIPEIMRRFEREAKATNLLSHPHIVEVLDFGSLEGGAPYLVMEAIRGQSLGDLIDAGTLDPLRGLRIIRQILDALTHAHAVGIVHRDLKPDNVMLVKDQAGGDYVKLLDFGIAKVVGEAATEVGSDTLTLVGTAFGTPEYMAPEQALGVPTDHRADLYAMGILLFEVLTGHQPFRGADAMTVARMQVQNKPPTLNEAAPGRGWPHELQLVLDRALAKLPDERYASAQEMLAAVDALIVGMAPDEPPPGSVTLVPATGETPALLAHADAASSGITDLAAQLEGASVMAPLPAAPERRPARPRWVIVVASLLVAAAVVIAVVGLVRRHPARAVTKPAAGAKPSPAKSELALAAERKLDSGDAAGAAAMLETGLAPPAGDDDAYGHFLLGHARTITGAHAEAVTAYEQAIRVAAELGDSKILRADLVTILAGKDKAAAQRAFALLGALPSGVEDTIVEQASRGKYLEVRARARALAKQRGLTGRVDELESYSLDLEQGATCPKRKEAVRRLRALGRKEAIPVLRQAVQPRGGERPNACLEREAAAAVRYLEGLK